MESKLSQGKLKSFLRESQTTIQRFSPRGIPSCLGCTRLTFGAFNFRPQRRLAREGTPATLGLCKLFALTPTAYESDLR